MEYVKEPECTFGNNEKCFARREGRCLALVAMPKPRKGGNCPFYKRREDKRRRDWEG